MIFKKPTAHFNSRGFLFGCIFSGLLFGYYSKAFISLSLVIYQWWVIKQCCQNEIFPLSFPVFIVHTMHYIFVPPPTFNTAYCQQRLHWIWISPSAMILFILISKNIHLMIKVETWHCDFHHHWKKTSSISPHWQRTQIYYLIIYLSPEAAY